MSFTRGTFAGGIHPPERKSLAESLPIEVLPTPKLISVPLLQHLGAPCEALVKTRDEVEIGQILGRSEAAISAPVHASIRGVVARPSVATLPNGRHVASIPIKAAAEQIQEGRVLYEDHFGGDWPTTDLDRFTPESITETVREAGLVGMGGAAFPTWVKLAPNPERPVDTLMVNGCECEPYLTADSRLMIEAAAPVVTGSLLAARSAGAERIVVAIEDNKPEAIAAMRVAADGTGVEIQSVPTKYPQGAEKQLVLAALERTVPGGGLPLDVGVVVINVGTAALWLVLFCGAEPLTHRIVTVSGDGVANPKNLLVPIGAAYRDRDRVCGRSRGGCGPGDCRRSDDGLHLGRIRCAGDQGHQRHHRSDPRQSPPAGGDGLRSLWTLCRCLSHGSGAHQDCPGSASRVLGPGPALPRGGLHGVWLLCLRMSGADPPGAADSAGQGATGGGVRIVREGPMSPEATSKPRLR